MTRVINRIQSPQASHNFFFRYWDCNYHLIIMCIVYQSLLICHNLNAINTHWSWLPWLLTEKAICSLFQIHVQKINKYLLVDILNQIKLIVFLFNIMLYFCTNRYICLLSTTSLKIALFMDNKLRLNIAGPGQEINDPKGFAQ